MFCLFQKIMSQEIKCFDSFISEFSDCALKMSRVQRILEQEVI